MCGTQASPSYAPHPSADKGSFRNLTVLIALILYALTSHPLRCHAGSASLGRPPRRPTAIAADQGAGLGPPRLACVQSLPATARAVIHLGRGGAAVPEAAGAWPIPGRS